MGGAVAVGHRRWAYEHKNEEAIELLQAAGIDEQAKDRGNTPPLYASLSHRVRRGIR